MRRAPVALFLLLTLTPAPLAAAPGPSLNVYFQSTLKDTAYQKKTFDRAAKAWRTPPRSAFPKAGAKAVVQAVISREGKLVSATVSTSSGSKAWDDAALAAVKGAAPYDPLPSGYAFPSLEAHFHVAAVETGK